jgi:GDP-L-fucose synthase
LNKNSLIYVTGHKGLAGSALVKELRDRGYNNLLLKKHSELDLRNAEDVEYCLKKHKPKVVIMAAAHAGGLKEAINNPVWMLMDNMEITSNVIRASFLINVEKLIFLSSSCVYPINGKQPYKEEVYGSGRTDENWAYAIAKVAGTELCRSFYRQYDCNYLTVIPCNLYGPNDNFHERKSHVIPALIRKFDESPIITVWGNGHHKREFLYTADFASACIDVMEKCNYSDIDGMINIGAGEDVYIYELARRIGAVVRPNQVLSITCDTKEPGGVESKLLDNNKITNLGWKPRYSLEEGIRLTYEWWKAQD